MLLLCQDYLISSSYSCKGKCNPVFFLVSSDNVVSLSCDVLHFPCKIVKRKISVWPKMYHQTPMTCTFINHYMDTSTGTPPSLEEKKALPNCGNKEIHVLKIVYPPLLQQFWSVWNDCTRMYKSLVFGDEFLAQGLHLESHQKCSAGIRTGLSADQSSSSTLTE